MTYNNNNNNKNNSDDDAQSHHNALNNYNGTRTLMTVGTTFPTNTPLTPTNTPLIYSEEGLVSPH